MGSVNGEPAFAGARANLSLPAKTDVFLQTSEPERTQAHQWDLIQSARYAGTAPTDQMVSFLKASLLIISTQ